MSILNEIAARTKERIAEEKFKFPLRKLISQQNSDLAKHAEEKISFLEALKKPGMSYICEVKKASPSKGLIAPDFPYLDIAKEYEQAGASAISCLTALLVPGRRQVFAGNFPGSEYSGASKGFYSR